MPITTAQALLAIDFLDLIPSHLIRDPIVGSHKYPACPLPVGFCLYSGSGCLRWQPESVRETKIRNEQSPAIPLAQAVEKYKHRNFGRGPTRGTLISQLGRLKSQLERLKPPNLTPAEERSRGIAYLRCCTCCCCGTLL